MSVTGCSGGSPFTGEVCATDFLPPLPPRKVVVHPYNPLYSQDHTAEIIQPQQDCFLSQVAELSGPLISAGKQCQQKARITSTALPADRNTYYSWC